MSSVAALRRLLGELSDEKRRIALILVLGLLVTLVQPLSVKLTQQVIDELKRGADSRFYYWVPLTLIPLFILSGLAKYFYNTRRRYLTERLIIKLRASLFHQYLMFPMGVIEQRRAGDLMANLQNDLAHINTGIDTFFSILKEPFAFFGLLGMAFYFDWRLTLVTLVSAPLIVVLFAISGRAVKRYAADNLEQFSDLMALSQEGIAGARVVKVFGMERPLDRRFRSIQESFFVSLWKAIRVQEIGTPSVELIGAFVVVGIFLYGGYRISLGQMSTGELFGFVLTIGLCQMPIKQMNNAYLKLKMAESAASRVYGLLDVRTPSLTDGKYPASFTSRIVFEGVGLAYAEKQVLDSVSFSVELGQTVALVGASGSGKTSLVNLLPRLYEASEGRILFDGIDIREFSLESLRSLMSFVTQDTFLFHDTLFENIRYGNPEATVAEVERAAEQAHCIEFIRSKLAGFATRVGDRGAGLSGGERQRIAIARALLKNAPILVLDEATSNLDTQSELAVQEALRPLMRGKTVFLITHRRTPLEHVDQIVVLDRGQVIDSGTHEGLVSTQKHYRELFQF